MAEEAIAAGGVMGVSTVLQEVLKTALIHNDLARGLPKAAKTLDECHGHLCVLAPSCDEPMYVEFLKAHCAEHQIHVIQVDDNRRLGGWTGLCRTDQDGKPWIVVGCSCVVVKDYGKESQAKVVSKDYFNARNE